MKWDARRRIYIRPNGSIVTPQELRERIEKYIDSQKAEVEGEAGKLIFGTLTATVFFSWLRDKITQVHGAAGLVAYGGEDEMDGARWARIGEKIASESAFAQAFKEEFLRSEAVADLLIRETLSKVSVAPEQLRTIIRTTHPASDIPRVLDLPTDAFGSRLESLIFGQTEARSTMYMNSIYGTYENSVKAREGEAGAIGVRRVTEQDKNVCQGCEDASTSKYVPMDEILDIGDAECMSACRCHFEFEYHGIEPLKVERSVYVA